MVETDPGTRRLALLIDADNVRASFLPIIIREASAIGTITIRRVYGHFASASMTQWQKVLHEHALTPVHVPPASRGKNATDMKLAIEAMDLLHQKDLAGICIASSDSDFTALASRIREDGVMVYGFGESKTTAPYVAACDRFFYCDILLERQDEDLLDDVPKPRPEKAERKKKTEAKASQKPGPPIAEILSAVEDASGDDGWARLGTVGQMMIKRMPDFDPRNYGYRKLSDLMGAVAEIEQRRSEVEGGGTILQVRRRAPVKRGAAP
ncbi:MAG TPA: NYN domain-containing protein [Bauldia sp.]|nr:NYN domain-containing protein [Bauldia sp.]